MAKYSLWDLDEQMKHLWNVKTYAIWNIISALSLVVSGLHQFQSGHWLCAAGVCSLDKIIPAYFLRLCKVLSILQHRTVGWVDIKTFTQSLFTSLALFCCFSSKICVFIIFISFFDKVSNFHKRILINQRDELVVSNCQWNCMEVSSLQ